MASLLHVGDVMHDSFAIWPSCVHVMTQIWWFFQGKL